MASTEIWTLPTSLDGGTSNRVVDLSRPWGQRIFYAKFGVHVIGMLDTGTRVASEWVIPASVTPPNVVPSESLGSASRLSLSPGSSPRLWAVIDDWNALARLDPATNELIVYSSTGSGPPDEGGAQPFALPRAILAGSATRIWYSANSYPDRVPLIGLLDTLASTVTYWKLGGPAADCSVEDLALDADGRVWFVCSGNADAGEKIAFAGVLDRRHLVVRYWTSPGVPPEWPDRIIAARRLGARNRLAAGTLWLVMRNHFGSHLHRVATADDSFLFCGTSSVADGRFHIALRRPNAPCVGYRDFLRDYRNVSACRGPTIVESEAGIVQQFTAGVRTATDKNPPRTTRLRPRIADTAVAEATCTRDFTPAAPYLCGCVQAGGNGSVWLARENGNEIGLLRP